MLMALLLMTAPSTEVFLKENAVSNHPVAVFGTLRRTPEGTVVMLDDGTAYLLTHDAPPGDWLPLVGKFIRVSGTLEGNRLAFSSPPAAATRALSKLNGKQVELHGTPANAKGGAILLVDGEPIYLLHLASWPNARLTKPLAVKGTLKSMKLLPSPERSPAGAVSQGAEGNQWVLEGATY